MKPTSQLDARGAKRNASVSRSTFAGTDVRHGPGRKAAMAKARSMLARVKPFEEWVASPGLVFPWGQFASPREFYDAFVDKLSREAESPTPTMFHVGHDGRLISVSWK